VGNESQTPNSLILGPVGSMGSILIVSDWEDQPHATFTILSSSGDGLKSSIALTSEDIARLVGVTISAFEVLMWPVPD
jgi:hypothetical protein